jgi:sensor histidine kinase YesM
VKWSATASPILPVAWQKGEIRVLGIVVLVCCAIGLAGAFQQPLSAVSIRNNLVPANATGLSIYAIATFIRLFFNGRLPPWGIALAILLGNILGSKLAALTGSPDYIRELMRNPVAMRRTIVNTVALGIVVTAFFLYLSHSRGVKEQLERERRRAAEALQAETLARLSLLQAQIEPHFLFNTLANIHSLIKEDPEAASVVLEQLNSYLRTSLRRTREPTSTVGEELELVEALLGIAAVRLGSRIEYSISAPADLRAAPLPPLLLQPLVENAVRHGIEPAIEGGRIHVEVCRRNGDLEFTVSDTGMGLDINAPGGVGLANVRARLAALYGVGAKLEFYANSPHGVIAKVLLPSPATRVKL